VFETSQVAYSSPAQKVSEFHENWRIWRSPANLFNLVTFLLYFSVLLLLGLVERPDGSIIPNVISGGFCLVFILLPLLDKCLSRLANANPNPKASERDRV
jgi:hypothetical protein